MFSAMCVASMFGCKGTHRNRGFGFYQSITNVVSAFGPALGGTYSRLRLVILPTSFLRSHCNKVKRT